MSIKRNGLERAEWIKLLCLRARHVKAWQARTGRAGFVPVFDLMTMRAYAQKARECAAGAR